MLESYPDHPGLLILRSLTESMCSDIDEVVCQQSLLTFYNTAVARYNFTKAQVVEALKLVAEVGVSKANKVLPSFIFLAFSQWEKGEMSDEELESLLRITRKVKNKETQRISKVFFLQSQYKNLENFTKDIWKRYEAVNLNLRGDI